MIILCASFISCGGGLSEADIAKKATEKLDSEKATLMTEADKICQELVESKVDSITSAMEAAAMEDENKEGE